MPQTKELELIVKDPTVYTNLEGKGIIEKDDSIWAEGVELDPGEARIWASKPVVNQGQG